ncbi:MAG: hypothetical protein ABL879_06850 [Devosia sp.]
MSPSTAIVVALVLILICVAGVLIYAGGRPAVPAGAMPVASVVDDEAP